MRYTFTRPSCNVSSHSGFLQPEPIGGEIAVTDTGDYAVKDAFCIVVGGDNVGSNLVVLGLQSV